MTQQIPYVILPSAEHGRLYSILPDGGIVLMSDLFAEMLRQSPIPVQGGKVTFVPDEVPETTEAPADAPAEDEAVDPE